MDGESRDEQDRADALGEALRRVVGACRRNPAVADVLESLCGALLAVVAESRRGVVEQASAVREAAPATPEGPPPLRLADALEAVAQRHREGTLKEAEPADGQDRWFREDVGDEDLATIEARLRLKAEACRWAAERERRVLSEVGGPGEIFERDADFFGRAKEIEDCYLWMLGRGAPMPEDPADFDLAAAWFDAVGSGVALVRELVVNDSELALRQVLAPALQLLAEAQSGLRGAIRFIWHRSDRDQWRVHRWLENTTSQHRIYVARFMRGDDPADPSLGPDVVARIEGLAARVHESRRGHENRKAAFNKLRYHARALGSGDAARHEHDWRRVVECVDELVTGGVAPSSVELRDVILPIVDTLHAGEVELPPNMRLVLAEIDRYIASRPPEDEDDESGDRARAPQVESVRRLLSGTKVLLIGGVCRTGASEALERAFDLDELVWLSTREHQSIEPFLPWIARPEVALVVLAIRWSSHSFGDIRDACERHGKPLVRLPAGYGPNQVAAQVLSQVSDRLQPQAAPGA